MQIEMPPSMLKKVKSRGRKEFPKLMLSSYDSKCFHRDEAILWTTLEISIYRNKGVLCNINKNFKINLSIKQIKTSINI